MNFMAVIQPGIKSVFAKNITGNPLLLNVATFILNINSPFPNIPPANGSYRFRYKADTGKMELSTDNGQTYSGDFSVTSDGSTFNNDVDSTKLNFILQSNPNEADEFEAVIKDAAIGSETTIKEGGVSQTRNYGSTDSFEVGISFDNDREALIRFNIQIYFSDLFGTEAESIYGRTISSFMRLLELISGVNQDAQFSLIDDSDGDWIEGTANGATQTGSPDWNHKAHDTVNWAGGAGTPALVGGPCTEKLHISAGLIYYIFNDEGGRLNNAIDSWLKTTVNNGMRTVAPHLNTNSRATFVSSENSTGNWRPLLCFIYEAVDGKNHGVSGGGFSSSADKPNKELELAKSLQITDEIDDTYATEFGSQE